MTRYDLPLAQKLESDHLVTTLRIALGVIFVVGGLKLALPTLFGIPDSGALAQSYVDPANGWISPFFAEKLERGLGMSIGKFLELQGLVEIGMGVAMICGIFTRMVAVAMGLMFWAFTIASPVVGEIRLSRDLALMGLCFAVAISGASTWSVDRLRRHEGQFGERRNFVLITVRVSLAFTMVVSAVFSGGVLSNPLNTTLPVLLVLALGVALAAGIVPRWITAFVSIWMLYVIATTLWAQGWLVGLDSIKREVGLLAGSLLYTGSGPDRWSYPRPEVLPCRSVVELIMDYLEDRLENSNKRAFERHLADCSNCWRFLKTYRETVRLGQSLREEDIPPEMARRLEAFLASGEQRS